MKYLLIFLFACTSTIERTAIQGVQSLEKDQYIVYDQPDFPDDYHQIEYLGNWVHMDKGGSFANTLNDTARFEFWGYGVQIRTELMDHHKAYQVIIDGKYIESINVQHPNNTVNNLTYSNMELSTGNHIIELVPDGGYFVLNSLTIHYFVDPTPNVCDTVYLPGDTIRISDTVYLPIDTVYQIDTIHLPLDTIFYLLKPIYNYDTILIE